MPTTELRLRLDDGLLAKARALAQRRGSTLEEHLLTHLTQWVLADKRRRLARALRRPYADPPTVNLTRKRQEPEDDNES